MSGVDLDDSTEIVTEAGGLRGLVTRHPRAGLRPAHWTWCVMYTSTRRIAAGPRWALTERAAWRRADRAWARAVNP